MSNDLRNQPESYWKEKLTPDQYYVLRQKGTERPFTGTLYHNHELGTYACGACGQSLFMSDAKYDSGCGWPSFDRPIESEHIEYHEDHSHGMKRVEVLCKNCGSHLGHVFDDGPRETTGQRYCINSVSLRFAPAPTPTDD
jgi:methionine-R-sulfoxide reductase